MWGSAPRRSKRGARDGVAIDYDSNSDSNSDRAVWVGVASDDVRARGLQSNIPRY